MRFGHILALFVFFLLFLPFAFAYRSGDRAECIATCKSAQDAGVADAEATAAANQYYLGETSGNCGSIRSSRAGEIDPCTMTTYGHPAVGINGCMQTCDADGSCAACIAGYQTCCLAQTKENFQIQYDECIAGCPAEVTDPCQGKSCTFGCDSSTGDCKDDPCIGVTCHDNCDASGMLNHDGRCGLSGECIYAIDSCPSGQVCDASSGSCRDAAQSSGSCSTSDGGKAYCKAYCEGDTGKNCDVASVATNTNQNSIEQCSCLCDGWQQSGTSTYKNLDCSKPVPKKTPVTTDKCKDVKCEDKCFGAVMYETGRCVDPGSCTYATETPCPNDGQCDAAGTACAGVEICYDGIDNDGNGLIDCQDPACTANPVCGPLEGKAYFKDKESDRVLKQVEVTVRWTSQTGAKEEAKAVYTDDKGEFTIDDSSMHEPGVKGITLVGTLDDSGKQIIITSGGLPVEQVTLVDMKSWASGNAQDIEFQPYNEDDKTYPQDGAKIYFHTKEFYDWANALYANVLGLGRNVAQERSNEHDDSKGTLAAWHSGHSGMSGGIYYSTLISSYTYPDAPTNREYHENSHHLMNDVFGSMPVRHWKGNVQVDVNHHGIDNHCSSDSWIEGFAEFNALYVQSQTKEPKRCDNMNHPYDYCIDNSVNDIESNYKPQKSEELAVAGILWDLYDSSQINGDGAPDDDAVSIPYDTLMKTLMKKRSFAIHYTGDEANRHITYVKDIYDAVSEDKLAPQADIDQIFAMHGFSYPTQDDSGRTITIYGAQTDPQDSTKIRY